MSDLHTLGVAAVAALLQKKELSAVELATRMLARLGGNPHHAFLNVDSEVTLAQARAADARIAAGEGSPLLGIPIAHQDIFVTTDFPTTAGSRMLEGYRSPFNATVVQRLSDAGMVTLGKLSCDEFAMGSANENVAVPSAQPQAVTNPWDVSRIPGGSSAGAGVSIADEMAYGALGTDTGGSCRIPAAMNGIVGYTPTARRVPIAGVIPLSTSLDSIGPLANSVACCAAIDAIFAGLPLPTLTPTPLTGLRLGAIQNMVLNDMDPEVATAYEAALTKLSAAGAHIIRTTLPQFDEIPRANARGTFAAAEAWAWHRDLIATQSESYDLQVLRRILPGRDMAAADYVALLAARADICARANIVTQDYDAMIMPTCPLLPPAIAALEADAAEYARVNLLQLRNCALGNFLDRCAISLPCTPRGTAPVGLMLMGETMGDAKLFRVAAAVEEALK